MFIIRFNHQYYDKQGERIDEIPPRFRQVITDMGTTISGGMLHIRELLGKDKGGPAYILELIDGVIAIYWDGTDYLAAWHPKEELEKIKADLSAVHGIITNISLDTINEAVKASAGKTSHFDPSAIRRKRGADASRLQKWMFCVALVGLSLYLSGMVIKYRHRHTTDQQTREVEIFHKRYDLAMSVKGGAIVKATNPLLADTILKALKIAPDCELVQYELSGGNITLKFKGVRRDGYRRLERLGKIRRSGEIVELVSRK